MITMPASGYSIQIQPSLVEVTLTSVSENQPRQGTDQFQLDLKEHRLGRYLQMDIQCWYSLPNVSVSGSSNLRSYCPRWSLSPPHCGILARSGRMPMRSKH